MASSRSLGATGWSWIALEARMKKDEMVILTELTRAEEEEEGGDGRAPHGSE